MSAQLVRLAAAPDLVDQAYRALLDAISSGELAPGERITQEDLAERLAVSRQPVLQALRLLKKEGLVQDAPGRGLQVAPLDTVALVHIYQVRGALDSLAARLAAERRAELPTDLLRKGRLASRSADLVAKIEADLAFHRALYAASGNPFIQASAENHWCHIRRAMGAVLQSSSHSRPLWDEHEAIADAVARGEPDAAAAAADIHARQASDHLALKLTRQLTSHLTNPLAAQGDT